MEETIKDLVKRITYLENVNMGFRVCRKCGKILCKRRNCGVGHYCDCQK